MPESTLLAVGRPTLLHLWLGHVLFYRDIEDAEFVRQAARCGLLRHQPLAGEVAGAHGDIGAVVCNQDLAVRRGRGRVQPEGVDAPKGIAQASALAAFRVTAVGLELPPGGKEAARMPGGCRATVIIHGRGTGVGAALAHEHHGLHPRPQAGAARATGRWHRYPAPGGSCCRDR